jgi:hypothetical protein
MDQAIVGDHVRHREDPGVPRLGEHVDAHAGQRAMGRDQVLVHAVHAPDQPTDTIQIQARHRGTGEHTGRGAGGDQGPHRRGVEFHIGVEVDPGKAAAFRVAEAKRVRLARHWRLDDADPARARDRGRTIGAGVGDHDHVELARSRAGEQYAQVGGDHRLLVVRRHHDAGDRRPARLRVAHVPAARLLAHANRLPPPADRIAGAAAGAAVRT